MIRQKAKPTNVPAHICGGRRVLVLSSKISEGEIVSDGQNVPASVVFDIQHDPHLCRVAA